MAQGVLIIGGVLSILISHLAAYFLYWSRVHNRGKPAQRYGLVTHKVTLWNGFLLLGLSIVIDRTNYSPTINTVLAVFQVISALLANGSNINRWRQGMEDQFRQGPEWRVRAIGFVHIIDLFVISAILVGVTRTALGLWPE
jgi:hypothetical protein